MKTQIRPLPDCPGPGKATGGFIVIAVLWILAAIATLAAIYAVYVKSTTASLADFDDQIKVQSLAAAGIELAVYRLTEVPGRRPPQGSFGFRLGNADIAVDFRSENGRIDLNFASPSVLAGLFTVLGTRREDADRMAERIAEWRTPLAAGATDNEAELYRAAGRKYGPRRGPFQHVNELGLVLGLPQSLIERALPYLTVFSGQAEVNVFSASPEVLNSLPGLTPERIRILLAQRDTASQDVLNAQLGIAAQYATVQSGRANRITVEVRYGPRRRMRSEAVVLVAPDEYAEPFRIMSWRDDIDR